MTCVFMQLRGDFHFGSNSPLVDVMLSLLLCVYVFTSAHVYAYKCVFFVCVGGHFLSSEKRTDLEIIFQTWGLVYADESLGAHTPS